MYKIFESLSSCNELLFVVDLSVQTVEISDEIVRFEWDLWLYKIGVLRLNFVINFLPFFVQRLSIFLVLLHSEQLLLLRVHLEGFVKCKWVNLFQDSLQSNQGLLKNLVPMVLSKVNDDGHQHWECLLLVRLQDVKEVIILKKAHCSIRDLQMDTANASDNSLEESWDDMFDLINFAYFKDFLKLGQEECFLDAVCKWPVLEEAFKKRNCQCPVLC